MRRKWIRVLVYLILGLSSGSILWKYVTWQQSSLYSFRHEENRFETKATEGILEDAGKDDDIEELRTLIQQKFRDMKEAGVLDTVGKQRMCTDHEEVLSRCIDPDCTGSLPPITSSENIKSVMKPLKRIGMARLKEVVGTFNLKPIKKKYVIVTAASSNHFKESQNNLESLHKTVLPHISDYSIYYYDLGLKDNERELIRKFSGAELRSFPFHALPAYMRYLKCYIWKPLIILAHLQQSEFLLWMDTSVNFTKDITPYFQNASKTGLIMNRNKYVMPQNTMLKMFSYFGNKPCQFSTYGEMETGILVFHNEPFIRRLIIEPWGACALDPDCMCPEESTKMWVCLLTRRKYGKCHRYEQAALGYMAIKLFRDNIPSVIIKDYCHIIQRGKEGSYLFDLRLAAGVKSLSPGV